MIYTQIKGKGAQWTNKLLIFSFLMVNILFLQIKPSLKKLVLSFLVVISLTDNQLYIYSGLIACVDLLVVPTRICGVSVPHSPLRIGPPVQAASG